MADKVFQFLYGTNDLIPDTQWSAKGSRFDEILESHWNEAKNNGYFNFTLDHMQTRVLPGQHGFVANLNMGRGSLRRKPQSMMSLSQPYDPQKFNFTKVDKREVILELCNEGKRDTEQDKHLIIINVSPIQHCSVLLVPSINSHLPQVLTVQSLEIAIEMTLLSAKRSLLVGWNSLCANASVNHLHFHAYYLDHQMRLQTEPTNHLAGPCHVITSWPVPCFVFQLERREVRALASNVYRVVECLHKSEIAHNVCLTRGAVLGNEIQETSRNTLRAFIWPRSSVFGVKEADAFTVAFSELVGHTPVPNKKLFQDLTDHSAAATLRQTSLPPETFQSVAQDIQRLFEEKNL